MSVDVRYLSFDDFYSRNQAAFQSVLAARGNMQSPQELGMSGQALLESERLSYVFLNFADLCSELQFGLSASVLDAKQDYRDASANFMRESGEKSVKAKEVMLFSDETYKKEVKRYNGLFDLSEYLDKRHSNFMACHYYYKNLANGGKNG